MMVARRTPGAGVRKPPREETAHGGQDWCGREFEGCNFDVLVTRNDVEAGKPDPETFLKAAALLRVDPSNCLALEDSHSGVRAAAAAGMATIMIPDLLHPTPEIASVCVGVLPSLNDVRIRISQQL